jgi:predicted transcriptional regulator
MKRIVSKQEGTFEKSNFINSNDDYLNENNTLSIPSPEINEIKQL